MTGVSFDRVKLWDTTTGKSLAELQATSWVKHYEFSPDNSALATSSTTGNALLWTLNPGLWVDRACEIVGRNLSPKEWMHYVGDGALYRQSCLGKWTPPDDWDDKQD